jgi:hypothetical protein
MASAINPRILRAFLTSLLESQLRWKELERFADDLSDSRTIRTIQEATYQLADTLRKAEAPRPPGAPRTAPDNKEEALLDFINLKRLSKMQVRERILAIAPDMPLTDLNERKTMRELIQMFLLHSPNKMHQFIEQFSNESHGDAYLKGIIGRDKG